jgi:hypothetical protein
MAIQNKLRTGLQFDGDLYSLKYFGVSENYTSLKRGSNIITLTPSKYLLPGSRIAIEVIHENGTQIPVQNENKNTKSGTTVLRIVIPENIPAGGLDFYIAGIAIRDYDTNTPLDTSSINTVWHGISRIRDSDLEIYTPEDIILSKPVVDIKTTITAVDVPYYETSGSRSTSSLFEYPIKYFPVIFEYTGDRTAIDRNFTEGISKVFNSQSSSFTELVTIPTSLEYPSLVSTEPVFTSDMVGGSITLQPLVDNYVPSNKVGTLPTIPNYTSNIVNVINNTTVNVDKTFSYIVQGRNTSENLIIDRFDANTFSVDYNYTPQISPGQKTTGYAKICFTNTATSNGKIDKVKVGAKPVGAVGAPVDIGTYTPYPPQKLNISTAPYPNIQTDPRLGIVSNTSQQYATQEQAEAFFNSFIADKSGVTVASNTVSQSSSYLLNSTVLNESADLETFSVLEVKSESTSELLQDTEYVFEFDAYGQVGASGKNPGLEIYIKGTGVDGLETSTELGTRIGIINTSRGQLLLNQSYKFKTAGTNINVQPLLVNKGGNWHISKVSLKPTSEKNNSPNELCVDVPLDNLPVNKINDEYIFIIDFIGSNGKPLNLNIITNSLIVNRNSTIDENLFINTINSSLSVKNLIVNLVDEFESIEIISGSFDNETRTLTLFKSNGDQVIIDNFNVTGPQGVQGSQGIQGRQGVQGNEGPYGLQGYQGNEGPYGLQGYQGNEGPYGAQGFQGFQGNIGAQGFQGFQGNIGAQGIQGFQGNIGAQGIQGFQGNIGAQGIQGFQGFQGNIGAQGIQGFQGAQGIQGFQGFQGNTGAQGIQGFQGFQGNIGAQGIQGFQGAQGIQGFQGFQGNIGAQGIQGFQGFQGNIGAQGIQGIQGIRGFQGFTGEPGIGVQGFQGLQGIQGFQGIQGIQGAQGVQCFTENTAINISIFDTKPIKEFKVKDEVMCYNIEQNLIQTCTIRKIHKGKSTNLIVINEEIYTTDEHPFYVYSENNIYNWKRAKDLRIGDKLKTVYNEVQEIISVYTEILQTPVDVYNFTIDDFSNFYVHGMLVHNADDFSYKIGPQGTQGIQGYQGDIGAQGIQGYQGGPIP